MSEIDERTGAGTSGVRPSASIRELGMSVDNEEMAAELAVPPTGLRKPGPELPTNGLPSANAERDAERSPVDARSERTDAGRMVGWFGLAFAIASLFVWPLLLGLTAAAIGYYAFRQGSKALGLWSITIGLLAAAAYIVFIPIAYLLS
ncbi:hypothetical protein BG53_15050 [Paenibacillus darwinianus]|uniref:DUF4190 domain-containing protein n=1 Tax=Paenibacillus darwinianus TaxID=1380763 RepID=A0A9W5S425_9BACL|nr:hypothetical protein [Paenibacillus darwinianus]EXX91878.1 hypothetical protein BG52_06115 [Paenibacillus darwinianus]EXX92347.1 hypothetical protein BG53_15050 [Paenibacillus darwinianus]EXX92721.1 hypothetical protein CH50_01970 [Paenibacillus darwinianus]